MSAIRAIGDTLFVEHVHTAETSNVNIKMVDLDIAIKKTSGISYNMVVVSHYLLHPRI